MSTTLSPSQLDQLIDLVCDEFPVDRLELLGTRQTRDVLDARCVLVAILHYDYGMTLNSIARRVWGVSQKSTAGRLERHIEYMAKRPSYVAVYERCRRQAQQLTEVTQ